MHPKDECLNGCLGVWMDIWVVLVDVWMRGTVALSTPLCTILKMDYSSSANDIY
jgi:hypothetical protein